MADVKKLIELILSDPKLAGAQKPVSSEDGADENGEATAQRVYRDEPIIKTASQMASYIPQKYRDMRNIARAPEAYGKTETWLFYHQAKFMAEFEDSFDYQGEFFRYYPTYRAMNDLQLRGYFSWRTEVRRGNIKPTSLSYVFVYIYELINLIGVDSPEDGFARLRTLWTEYSKADIRINSYMKIWLTDFVVYYNLDQSLLGEFSDNAFDAAFDTLARLCEHNEAEIFEAITALSTYNIERSRLYRECPEDFKAVCCAVLARLSEYYGKNRKYGLCERLFGRVCDAPYYMFSSAVFYDIRNYQSYNYVISETCEYNCRRGRWSRKAFLGKKEKSRELGAIIKTVDSLMRGSFGTTQPVAPGKQTKILTGIIEKEIAARLEENKKAAARKIEIDVFALSEIRRVSGEIRDKLIINEERDEYDLPEVLHAPVPDVTAVKNEPEAAACDTPGTALDCTELELVRCLLYGGDYTQSLRDAGRLVSVAVDSVNEKLFDMFGDTVICFEADKPYVLDDYRDELKGIIKP